MGSFNKEVELIPPKKQNINNIAIKRNHKMDMMLLKKNR